MAPVSSDRQLPSGVAPHASATGSPDRGDEVPPGPREEPTLDPLAVRVLRGEEPTLRVLHLALQVAQRRTSHAPVGLRSGDQPRVRVQLGQLGVVRQHLLEVRHVPGGIGRVPGEPATDLIAQAPVHHPVEREAHHVERVRGSPQRHPEQEPEHHGLGELRGPTEPTPTRGSKLFRRPANASRSPPSVSGSGEPVSWLARSIASVTLELWASISSRRVVQASARPWSTCRNEGIPCRGSSGKYVPA